MTVAYLGLGSNVGDRAHNLERARRALDRRGARVLRASSIIETSPWGMSEQGPFLNQVLKVEWPGGPRALLRTAREVETEIGRVPTYRWGPREIDVDILLFDGLVVSEPGLEVPHPRMWERDFVLIPLRELEPGVGLAVSPERW
jgi:2-amino-4-hydroxy-6-hydroxymethyldihydropteridine diphosphokinase